MLDVVRRYIREHRLMRAGDRVGVAVSGGADSVALLRCLLELRAELGVVLSVVHFNHKIRGAEADADEAFVRDLAAQHRLELHPGSADVPAHARAQRQGLETAARELRYAFFRELLAGGKLDRIATAHTADDQAETLLMRFLRGAWTKGLAGVHPEQSGVVRPMLCARRSDVEACLRTLGQDWREDASNRDRAVLRNRVRHELLPVILRDFNPGYIQVAADVAEIARAEEQYWEGVVEAALRAVAAETSLNEVALHVLPLAAQRRLIRAFAGRLGMRLDFEHVEDIRRGREGDLPGGWRLHRDAGLLRFERPQGMSTIGGGFQYTLPIPGRLAIPELGTVLRAVLLPGGPADSGYNPAQFLDARKLGPELVVRNWRPGDRFRPAHTKSAKKVKELLQEKRVQGPERALWPVAVRDDDIVWLRGFPPAAGYQAGSGPAVVIEESASEGKG